VPEYELRFDAMAIPEEYDDVFNSRVDSLALKLAGFFRDRSSRQYAALLREARAKRSRYVLLKRAVYHQDLKIVKTFPLLSNFRDNKKRFSTSLVAVRQNKRILPFT